MGFFIDGGKLRALRRDAGLSQRALARKAKSSQHTISELESGKHSAQSGTLQRLSKVLKVHPRELRKADEDE